MEQEIDFNSEEENESLYDEELGHLVFRLWGRTIKLHGKEYTKIDLPLIAGCCGCAFDKRKLACIHINCVKDSPGIYVRKEQV